MIGEGNMIKNFKSSIFNLKSEWGWVIGLGIGILVVFFLFRLINLTILPIFADEAIYVRWSQVMKAEPTLRFLPLSDGKQPLFMWILMFVLGVIKNPLFVGRFLSVLTGLGSLIGIFLLSYELFKNKKTALIAGLFYAIVPFFVFFDRMALVDSLLAMLGIWFFYFGLLLIKNLRLDLAMITGMILGAALITKSPAIFFAILLPTTLFIAPWLDLKKRKKTALQLIKVAGLWGVVYVFAFGIYNLLRLGPNFQLIALRNKDYVFSFKEILSHPFDPLKPHLFDLVRWMPNLMTWPVLLSGYLEEWTAGQGIKEIADFVKEIAKEKNVLIGTEGSFGTLPDGLQIYLEKVPRITVIGVGYPITGIHSSLVNSLVDNDVYLVVNQSRLQIPPEAYGLKLIKEYPKASNPEGIEDKLLFFEIDKEFWQKR